MTTILLSIDTDVERATTQAESITELPIRIDDTTIVLYHVFRTDDEGADAGDLKSVKKAKQVLEDAGFDVQIDQSSGDAVRNILTKADEIDAGIISLAGRKRSPTGKALFGSVTQNVVLKSDRTVLLETTE
ncbi:universal stress protein [Halostagnicola kamekurae]|uniref:Universal stress protein family protein n=1 Tax=Halostagnicola kamekurae TaxID=619731 RepID=A0A1I6TJI6_9EURY|nr:universal stress protein [Halostagnicola kamekurae]SFS89330.1 Universal stress protein family protein [Halostagnicola kamekurae]